MGALSDIKDELDEMRTCHRCQKKIKIGSSETNVCHVCEELYCNKCRLGPVCVDCAEKIPKSKLRLIRFIQFFRAIGTWGMFIGVLASCVLALGLYFSLFNPSLESWMIFLIIGTFVMAGLSLVLRAVVYTMVKKAVGEEIY